MATERLGVILGVALIALLTSAGTSNSSIVLRRRCNLKAHVDFRKIGSPHCPVDDNVMCPCGADMRTSVVQARQCRVYTIWGAICEPCDNKLDICKNLEHCLRCDNYNPAAICAECPLGRVGDYCQHEVTCPLPEIMSPVKFRWINNKRCNKVVFKLQFSCEEGAILNGPNTSKCLPSGEWSKPFPTCELATGCSKDPRHIEGARIVTRSEDRVVYECDVGFMAEQGKPFQVTMHCDNGKWTGDIIECVPRQKCLDVPFYHGAKIVETHTRMSGTYYQDDRLVFQCERTLAASGPASETFTLTCKDGRWDGKFPSCRMVSCAKFALEGGSASLDNSNNQWDSAPAGATVHIQCSGDRLPHPSQGLVTCSQTGRWEPSIPQCISLHKTCQSRCRLTKSENLELVPDWTEILPGQTVKYTCLEGSFRQGPEERICLCNGTLTGTEPSCTRIRTCNISHIKDPVKFCRGLQCSSKSKDGCKKETYIATYDIPDDIVLDKTIIEFYCEDEERYEMKGFYRAQCEADKPISVPSCRPKCGQRYPDKKPLVQGGVSTEVNEWPWQAAVVVGTKALCGAALVHDKWVLTAAHCVANNSSTSLRPADVKVAYGATNVAEFQKTARGVQRIYIHENFKEYDLSNDIALLELAGTAVMSQRVGIVCLPASFNCSQRRFDSGTWGIVTGWGKTEQGRYPSQLQAINMTVTGVEKCRQYFEDQKYAVKDGLGSQSFCSISHDSTQNTAEGDSGGPFVVQVGSTWVLEGLVSFAFPDDEVGGPAEGRVCNSDQCYTGFTRVSSYLPWIYDKLGITADTDRCAH